MNGYYNKFPWSNLDEFIKPNDKFEDISNEDTTFVPRMLPSAFTYDHKLVTLLAEAKRKVAELKRMGA